MTIKKIIPVLCVGLMAAGSLRANEQTDQQFIQGLRDQQQVTTPRLPASIGSPDIMEKLGKGDAAWLKDFQQKQQSNLAQQTKPHADALYFLSFSIPEEGLKLMLPEAQKWGIPALVNGLIDNDFRKTAQAVFRLTQEGNNGGVQIDPTQFARFGIVAVPALVVVCGDRHDIIHGNIRILDGLEKIAEQGECGETAKKMLHEARQ